MSSRVLSILVEINFQLFPSNIKQNVTNFVPDLLSDR
jgi:hypothetical protein